MLMGMQPGCTLVYLSSAKLHQAGLQTFWQFQIYPLIFILGPRLKGWLLPLGCFYNGRSQEFKALSKDTHCLLRLCLNTDRISPCQHFISQSKSCGPSQLQCHRKYILPMVDRGSTKPHDKGFRYILLIQRRKEELRAII